MKTIYDLLDPEVILSMEVSDLAYTVLTLAYENLQNGKFNLVSFVQPIGDPTRVHAIDHQTRERVKYAVAEAFTWLQAEVLIAPDDGVSSNGWYFITRRGLAVQGKDRFESYRAAAAFPKSLLHPTIAEEVWSDLARGDLSTAVFRAFRTVEERVRSAACLAADDVGVKLMRNAFGPTGVLSDKSVPQGEQDALMNLFAGAIGSYKNPHSHRTVTISDVQEAQEMVLLASHLLRIVDSRVAKLAAAGQ